MDHQVQHYVTQGVHAYHGLDNRISTLQNQVAQLDDRVNQLDADTVTHDNVNEVAADLAALHDELETIEQDLDERVAANEADIDDLQATVTDLQTGVTALQSALDDVDSDTQQNSDALTMVHADLDELETDLNAVDAALNEKAAAADVAQLQTDVTALEQAFSAAYTDVTTVLSQHDHRLSALEATTYTQDHVNKLVAQAEANAQRYADANEQDTQLGATGFVALLEEFFRQPTNFIKEWVRTNFATKGQVNHLEERLIEHEARTDVRLANIERFTDQIYEDSEYEKDSELQAIQDAMVRNDIPRMDVEADGQTWHCSLTTQPARLGGGQFVTCVH